MMSEDLETFTLFGDDEHILVGEWNVSKWSTA